MTEHELRQLCNPLFRRMAAGFIQVVGGDGRAFHVTWKQGDAIPTVIDRGKGFDDFLVKKDS